MSALLVNVLCVYTCPSCDLSHPNSALGGGGRGGCMMVTVATRKRQVSHDWLLLCK